jgi:hypothetical protein
MKCYSSPDYSYQSPYLQLGTSPEFGGQSVNQYLTGQVYAE